LTVTVTVTNKSRTTGTCHHVSFLAWYGQSGRGYLPLALPPRTRWSCAEGRGVGVRPLGVLGGGLGRCGCVVHGMRSCAAGYLVSVVPSLSSLVRLLRFCRSRAMPLLVMPPPFVIPPPPRMPPSAVSPVRSGVSVSPRLSPPLLLRGLLHAQLRRYPHAYHVSFAPASRRAPSFVHVRHHPAPFFTPFRLVVAVNVDIFSSASLP
jgi:hypothetical protein